MTLFLKKDFRTDRAGRVGERRTVYLDHPRNRRVGSAHQSDLFKAKMIRMVGGTRYEFRTVGLGTI
jgi:hypothetical protein